MRHEPTLVDNLIDALRADCEKRGMIGYPYIAGYLSSMLQSLADSSPKVRKEIKKALQSVQERK